MIYPPIDGIKHFCGLGCLQKWLEEEKYISESKENQDANTEN
jgi:hypothetical protein